jgi:hypothetical protein
MLLRTWFIDALDKRSIVYVPRELPSMLVDKLRMVSVVVPTLQRTFANAFKFGKTSFRCRQIQLDTQPFRGSAPGNIFLFNFRPVGFSRHKFSYCLAAQALSTILGYERPAFFALFFAAAS